MLEVGSLTYSYGKLKVLDDISFELEDHSLCAVLGPNGAGKTTLLRCLNGILDPEEGKVVVEGRELQKYSGKQVARLMAYVAQRSQPGMMTAFDAVLLGRKPHIVWKTSRRDLELTYAALHLLDLEELALRYTHRMSGGEYQKVCMARALVQQPKVMLLDEPTASLDLKNQLAILRLLRTVVRGHDMCALVTMHDLNTAFRYADRFIFLKHGAVHADVDREGITSDIVESVYGVPVEVRWHRDRPFVLPQEEKPG
ncbi:MAG: ATP-binding cassette domain-containing protein [Candidatus Aegiribacteria sp.]|nr:ATP-binding cassette domain-containing protein [Candidatus Aegiribacteria sp.]MBD3294275.1 ATP-binding cassette domain-containing protein [Candidatus Fermentibacteria bacterium]